MCIELEAIARALGFVPYCFKIDTLIYLQPEEKYEEGFTCFSSPCPEPQVLVNR